MTEKTFTRTGKDLYREFIEEPAESVHFKFVHAVARALQWAYNRGQMDEHKKHCEGCPQCKEAG